MLKITRRFAQELKNGNVKKGWRYLAAHLGDVYVFSEALSFSKDSKVYIIFSNVLLLSVKKERQSTGLVLGALSSAAKLQSRHIQQVVHECCRCTIKREHNYRSPWSVFRLVPPVVAECALFVLFSPLPQENSLRSAVEPPST